MILDYVFNNNNVLWCLNYILKYNARQQWHVSQDRDK